MKTPSAIAAALIGFAGSASAFTVDFSAFAVGTPLNPDIVVNVPGYGNVRFAEAPNNNGGNSHLEITNAHMNSEGVIANSIGFVDGEQMVVTFENGPVININFDFAGVGSGEGFQVNTLPFPGDAQLVSFNGITAGVVAVSFDQVVPEPSSTLLVALAGLGIAARRRR
ncbi:MAG: PEP-CTERM sorting domain-containing protein [Verrucomicrobiaceae bacterium]